MSMRVNCPGCQKALSVRDELLDKKIKCPHCQTMLALRAPTNAGTRPTTSHPPSPKAANAQTGSMRISCQCGSNLKVPRSAAGKQVRCPQCKQLLVAPKGSASAQTHSPSKAPKKPAPQRQPVAAPISPTANTTPFPANTLVPANAPAPANNPDPFDELDSGGFELVDETVPATDDSQDNFGFDDFGAAPPTNADSTASGDDWMSLPPASIPSSPVTRAASLTTIAHPAIPQTGTKTTSSDEDALQAAGAYEQSIDEKFGNAVAQSHSADERDWGDYFSNRFHLALIIMIFAGPILMYAGWRSKQTVTALKANGVSAKGVIVSGYERRGRKGRRSYSVEIAFMTQDQEPRIDNFDVTSSFFKSHTAGDQIVDEQVEVIYLPNDPGEAIVVGGSTDFAYGIWLGLASMVIGSAGVAFTLFATD